MTKLIMVGVDGSESADLAALKAADLAHAIGASLRIVCAFDKLEVETFSSGIEQFSASSADDARRISEAVSTRVLERHPDVPVTPSAALGKPADVLVTEAELVDASLIVVGNKRVQGLSRVLGSIASSVASRASCDVYIAHTHPRD